ncbi:unnamed protein product [Trichobilharzia regenti]|nr:unnamed protein product [Trichobilharzia regenti]
MKFIRNIKKGQKQNINNRETSNDNIIKKGYREPTVMPYKGGTSETLHVCSQQVSCKNCASASTEYATCYWCPKINICSHGFDIHRPSWIKNMCHIENTTNCQDLTALNSDHDLQKLTSPPNELNEASILPKNNVTESVTEMRETTATTPLTHQTTELTSQTYYTVTESMPETPEITTTTTTRTTPSSSFSTSEHTTRASQPHSVKSTVVDEVSGNANHSSSLLFIIIPAIIIALLIAILCIIWSCVVYGRKSKVSSKMT